MNRVGLSLSISLALFIGYCLGVSILYGFVFTDYDQHGGILAAPLGLPEFVLQDVFLLEMEYGPLSLILLSLANIVIYAVPIYGILTLLTRLKPQGIGSPEPPPPPPSLDA